MPRRGPSIKHSTNRVHWTVDFIRRERVHQKITQEDLAIKASVNRVSLGNFESAVNTLSVLYSVERMLAALGYELHIRKKKK